MDKVKMEILDREPRPFRGKTSYYNLTDDEREAFVEKRVNAIKESDELTEVQKQAALMRSGMFGISTAAAFNRYVEQEPQWFA